MTPKNPSIPIACIKVVIILNHYYLRPDKETVS